MIWWLIAGAVTGVVVGMTIDYLFWEWRMRRKILEDQKK